MFTRTNIIVAILLFSLSFLFLSIGFSSHGIIAMEELEKMSNQLADKVERKSVEVDLLRSSLDRDEALKEEKELIYTFSDSHYEPTSEVVDDNRMSFKPLSIIAIFLYSLLPSLIYLTLCIIVRKLSNRRNYG